MATLNVSGEASGIGRLSGATQQVLPTTGMVFGVGTLTFSYIYNLSGTAAGAATIYGQIVKQTRILGRILGEGTLNVSMPLPIIGVGILAGYLELIHVPCPICRPHCTERCECQCHCGRPRFRDDFEFDRRNRIRHVHLDRHEREVLERQPWREPWIVYDHIWNECHGRDCKGCGPPPYELHPEPQPCDPRHEHREHDDWDDDEDP